MRGNGIFNTVTQICATKVCCKLFLQGSLFVGRLCNKLPLRSYCDFTARFLSVENGNYILFGICLSFHATVFFLFKTTFISLAFCPFTARFFVSVQNCNYVPLTFCRFTARCFYLFKTAIIFCLVFVCRFTALFCLFNICAVQNNVLCCSKQCKVQ